MKDKLTEESKRLAEEKKETKSLTKRLADHEKSTEKKLAEAFKLSNEKDAKLAGQTQVIAELKQQLATIKGKKPGGADMLASTHFSHDMLAMKEEKDKEIAHYNELVENMEVEVKMILSAHAKINEDRTRQASEQERLIEELKKQYADVKPRLDESARQVEHYHRQNAELRASVEDLERRLTAMGSQRDGI